MGTINREAGSRVEPVPAWQERETKGMATGKFCRKYQEGPQCQWERI